MDLGFDGTPPPCCSSLLLKGSGISTASHTCDSKPDAFTANMPMHMQAKRSGASDCLASSGIYGHCHAAALTRSFFVVQYPFNCAYVDYVSRNDCVLPFPIKSTSTYTGEDYNHNSFTAATATSFCPLVYSYVHGCGLNGHGCDSINGMLLFLVQYPFRPMCFCSDMDNPPIPTLHLNRSTMDNNHAGAFPAEVLSTIQVPVLTFDEQFVVTHISTCATTDVEHGLPSNIVHGDVVTNDVTSTAGHKSFPKSSTDGSTQTDFAFVQRSKEYIIVEMPTACSSTASDCVSCGVQQLSVSTHTTLPTTGTVGTHISPSRLQVGVSSNYDAMNTAILQTEKGQELHVHQSEFCTIDEVVRTIRPLIAELNTDAIQPMFTNLKHDLKPTLEENTATVNDFAKRLRVVEEHVESLTNARYFRPGVLEVTDYDSERCNETAPDELLTCPAWPFCECELCVQASSKSIKRTSQSRPCKASVAACSVPNVTVARKTVWPKAHRQRSRTIQATAVQKAGLPNFAIPGPDHDAPIHYAMHSCSDSETDSLNSTAIQQQMDNHTTQLQKGACLLCLEPVYNKCPVGHWLCTQCETECRLCKIGHGHWPACSSHESRFVHEGQRRLNYVSNYDVERSETDSVESCSSPLVCNRCVQNFGRVEFRLSSGQCGLCEQFYNDNDPLDDRRCNYCQQPTAGSCVNGHPLCAACQDELCSDCHFQLGYN